MHRLTRESVQLLSKTRKYLKTPKFWLATIAISLFTLHLRWSWQLHPSLDQLMISLFFVTAIVILLRRHKPALTLESDPGSSSVGLLLIIWMLFRGTSTQGQGDLLSEISPLISAFGLALLASGVQGLKQYWREGVILIALLIPPTSLSEVLNEWVRLNVLTAKVTTFALWYLGFNVSRQGVAIGLPNGAAIEVAVGCSGFGAMLLLWRLSVLFSILVSLKRSRFWLPVAALTIAFLVNLVRVGLMAYLLNSAHQSAFLYWHGHQGAQIFSTLSILLFGWLCHWLVQTTSQQKFTV